MTARERAEKMVELLDHGNGYMSMKFVGQSGLLWHSSDIKLMKMRKEEMVESIAKVIQETIDDFYKTPICYPTIGELMSKWNCNGLNEVRIEGNTVAKIEGNTVSARLYRDAEELSKAYDEMVKPKEEYEDFLDPIAYPKVDDTREFHLVRCPKCELMVEELVATPYRHVCASCAKGE